MKKNSFRVIAMVLAAMLTCCAAVAVFAYEAVLTPDTADGENATTAAAVSAVQTVAATKENKADYYSRNADMNEDWMLNSADARVILRLAAKIDWVKDPYWLPKGVIFGDIDENGVLNSSDARWALRVSAKLNTVPEVIAIEATRPARTTIPSAVVGNPTAPAATTVTTTKTEETSNPNYVLNPFCDEFSLKLKSASGVVYTIATDGFDCYIATNDLLSDLIVYVDRDGNTYLMNGSDKDYAKFKADFISKLGLKVADLRKFVASFAVPEYGVFDGCTVSKEYIDEIPFDVATRDGIKFYFYADGSLLKIKAKDYKGKVGEFTIEAYSDSASEYTSVLNDYKDIGSNLFLVKNGLTLLTSK